MAKVAKGEKMTFVYEYGLRPPSLNADIVDNQLILGNRYRNALVSIERKRRDAIRGWINKPVEKESIAYSEAIESFSIAETAMKKQRASTRSRSDTAEQRGEVKDLRKKKKDALSVLKAARVKAKKEELFKAEMDDAESQSRQEIKDARSECGLYWGTYLVIEAAMAASRKKMPLWDKHFEPANPRYQRWQGTGTVAVQVQKSQQTTADHTMECTGRLIQLDMEKISDEERSKMSKRRQKRCFGTLRMRVGSEGRDPIWAEWPIIMHRPLPSDSTITEVRVIKKKISDHGKWNVHITIKTPDGYYKQHNGVDDKCGSGPLALDLGWRLLGTGELRVAYTTDEDGTEEEIRLDHNILTGLKKSDELQGLCDDLQNKMKSTLNEWKKTHHLPDWFAEESSHIHAWKKTHKFVRLLHSWSKNRWDGDNEGFDILNDWHFGAYKEDLGRRDGGSRHLWQWREHQRKKSLLRRKDQYRVLAARLSRKYSVLILEDLNLSKLQEHNKSEDDAVEIKEARWQQRAAACYELRECLKQAFLSRGGRVLKVKAAMTTQRCFCCGCEKKWDPIPSINHTCDQCGKTWDQDANAAKNIMLLYDKKEFSEQSSGVKKEDAESLSKWGKIGRHKKTSLKLTDNQPEQLN